MPFHVQTPRHSHFLKLLAHCREGPSRGSMCGRARCTLRPEQIPSSCGFNAPLKSLQSERFRPSYNVSPGSYMPVVYYHQQEGNTCPVVHYMKWGLVPCFTKKNEKPDHFRMFNARSESVHEKASFRRLLLKCRCVAIAEGFYEWKKDGTKKQPYYIHFKDGRPLAFAALYDYWKNTEGEVLYTFTILTTCPSKAFGWLHDRMPVILGNKKSIEEWLNPDNSFPSVQGLMQPYDQEDLVWYAVQPAVGKISFDGPECIKQVKVTTEAKKSISALFRKQQDLKDEGEDAASVEVKKSAHRSVSDVSDEPPASDKPNFPDEPFLLDEEEMKAFPVAAHPDDPFLHKSGIGVEENIAEMKENQSKVKDAVSGDEVKEVKQETATDGNGIKGKSSPKQCRKDENGSKVENHGDGWKFPDKNVKTDGEDMKKFECLSKDGKLSSRGSTRKFVKSPKKEGVHEDVKSMKRRHSPDDEKSKRASIMVAGEKQTSLLNFFGKH